jgi:hypothetical protein
LKEPALVVKKIGTFGNFFAKAEIADALFFVKGAPQYFARKFGYGNKKVSLLKRVGSSKDKRYRIQTIHYWLIVSTIIFW